MRSSGCGSRAGAIGVASNGHATLTGRRLQTVRGVFRWLAPRRSVGLAAIVGLMLLASVPALAQEAGPGEPSAPAPLSERQVQALVETLRDDAAREELILALETLVEAERVRAGDALTSEGTGFGLAALSFLSQKVEAIGALATDVSRLVADLPELGRRLSAGAADPNVRERSFEFLLKLVLIVGAGFLGPAPALGPRGGRPRRATGRGRSLSRDGRGRARARERRGPDHGGSEPG